MYLAYILVLVAVLIPCLLALYVLARLRGGDEDAPGGPPPPPQPQHPDPVEPPSASGYAPDTAPSEHPSETEPVPV